MIRAAGKLRRPLTLFAGALVALLASTASAVAAPVLEVDGHHAPTVFEPGKGTTYTFKIQNVGDEALDVGYDDSGTPDDGSDDTLADPLTVEVQLPAGVTTRLDSPFAPLFLMQSVGFIDPWDCSASPDPITEADHDMVRCTLRGDVRRGNLVPGQTAQMLIYVQLDGSATGSLEAMMNVTGGGIAPLAATESAPVGPPVTTFGIVPDSFLADGFDREGQPERQAAARPFRAVTGFDFNLKDRPVNDEAGNPKTGIVPIDGLRNVEVDLPRGFYGNPNAVARCTEPGLLDWVVSGSRTCPPESQIGTIDLTVQNIAVGRKGPPGHNHVAVYNMVPPEGVLASFGFAVEGRPVYIRVYLDPRDYSVRAVVPNVNDTIPVHFQRLSLWGVPADPVHDGNRWNPTADFSGPESCANNPTQCGGWGASFEGPRKPFITLPADCTGPDNAKLRVKSWEGVFDPPLGEPPLGSEPAQLNGCDQVEFKPTVQVRPTTNLADAPTGLEFDLEMTQNEDPKGLGTAPLRDAVVKLPAGMTVNPPSADGLGACSLDQIGLKTNDPVRCPDAAKLGTVEAISPPVDHPLKGTVYLAEQNANPFGSLLAMYLVIDDPETGALVKLPGKVDPDQSTGQLTATFRENPQLPVEHLRLKFFEGPRAALKTPSTCGTHTTEATFTPWTSPQGADVEESSSFELTQGPSGGACLNGGGGAPNSPAFNAGTQDPTAKAFSPFVMRLARADGSQQIKAIETTLPKGLVAKLAGTTYCSDAALSAASGRSGKDERSLASCPASSRVGSVDVGAGAGSTPLHVSGEAYLAGPYKGAPLSLAIITPAVAGPFDLGTVVVRTALHVNSETAQVKALSDELPQILQGIPLNIRSIALKMDRPQFVLNPTSCDPMSVDGSALSVFNRSAALTNPFQVGECNKLGFKPKLAIGLKGSTKRAGHPALTATVKARPNDANIAKTVVALPHSEFLAQDHIRTICTRVQFAADQCPQGSIYGTASAQTPLLDETLSGNVYLRSSSNPLPDMVIALRGKIDVDLVGRIDSDKRGGIRTSFESVPDAPVSKFTLRMAGGRKSLLENSKNLCTTTNKATVQMAAQNGMAYESRPVVKSAGCNGKARKGKDGKKRGGGRR